MKPLTLEEIKKRHKENLQDAELHKIIETGNVKEKELDELIEKGTQQQAFDKKHVDK